MLNFWKPTFTQVNILAQNYCPGLLMIAFVTLGKQWSRRCYCLKQLLQIEVDKREKQVICGCRGGPTADKVTRWEETKLFAAINLTSNCQRVNDFSMARNCCIPRVPSVEQMSKPLPITDPLPQATCPFASPAKPLYCCSC